MFHCFFRGISAVFKEKCKQRNIQVRIVIVLILLALIMCVINLQFLLECNIATRIVNNTSKPNQQKKLFEMPMKDLMEMSVIS